MSKYALSNELIEPNEMFQSTVVVISKPFGKQTQLADQMFLAFDIEFSNGQIIESRSSISIAAPDRVIKHCNS